MEVVLVALAGIVVIGVAWDWFTRHDRAHREAIGHQRLLRELGRHD